MSTRHNWISLVSHRHGDHTSGLNHLLKVNPAVKIYAPQENFGVFGAALPGTFYRRNDTLPDECGTSRKAARYASFRHSVAGRQFHLDSQDDRDRARIFISSC